MRKFFLVTPIGFEEASLNEMKRVWPLLLAKDGRPHSEIFPEIKKLKGGLEFEANEFIAYQLNFFLKIPTRLLMRLSEFRVRDFPKLYEKFKQLPWLEHFHFRPTEFVVAAAKSRLNNEKRIEQTLVQVLEQTFPQKPSDDIDAATIYIRMDNDVCAVSLDTTGEHLHKRGWATLKGEAPLRETLASFILQKMMAGFDPSRLARVTLLDPMMGSGTFLLEARSMYSPAVARDFGFQKLKSCPKLFLSPQFPLNYKLPSSNIFKSYVGMDIDQEMVQVAQTNWSELEKQLATVERKNFAPQNIQFHHHDVFESFAQITSLGEELWIATNPPYGERLQGKAADELVDYVEALAQFRPSRMAVLYPERSRLKSAEVPAGYKMITEIPILNGGLKTILTLLERSA